AVISHMIKRGSGVIVNVSSVVGKRPVSNLAAYCASKFGLWGFSQSLRLELRPHGIQVCHFCPAATATGFHAAAGMEEAADSAKGMTSPDCVAAAMVEAVFKRKPEHIMSVAERLLIKFYLLAPAFTEGLLRMARRK